MGSVVGRGAFGGRLLAIAARNRHSAGERVRLNFAIDVGVAMQPDQPKQQGQPVPQQEPGPSPTPLPQRSSPGAPAPAGQRRRGTTLALGVLLVAALGLGAVATGLVHVPGFDSSTSAPPATSVTQSVPDQIDEGDHTVGVRWATLTPELAKARQLNTSRSAGVVFIDVFSGSPSEAAGFRVNDIIIAIDGIPVSRYDDAATKVRLTPIGQQMAITIERNGAIEGHSVKVGRCLVREAPRAPGVAPACQSWVN